MEHGPLPGRVQQAETDHGGLNGPADGIDHVGQAEVDGSQRGGHRVEGVHCHGGGRPDVLGVEAAVGAQPQIVVAGSRPTPRQTMAEAAGGSEGCEPDGLDAVRAAGVADGGDQDLGSPATRHRPRWGVKGHHDLPTGGLGV